MPGDKYRGTLEWTGPARDTKEEAIADMKLVQSVIDQLFKEHEKVIPGTHTWLDKSRG